MKPNVNILNGIQLKSQTTQHKNFSRALRETDTLDKCNRALESFLNSDKTRIALE